MEGLTYEPLQRLQQALELTLDELATLLQIPSRTLARRKRTGRLQPDESDRLVRAAILFERTVGLFEKDRDAARRWFMSPHPGLGGNSPFEFSRTDVGAREVEQMIGRLEQGVVS
jgi:putative toxin-antitoxin system antitoxin component (TIGR02293 family)